MESLRKLTDNPIQSVVTDAPCGLGSLQILWRWFGRGWTPVTWQRGAATV
jgi:hypothetical protein